MRRGIAPLLVTGSLATVIVLTILSRPPVDAQDRTEERLTTLETRVAALETIVAGESISPEGSATTATNRLTGAFELVTTGFFLRLYDGDQCKSIRPVGFEVGAQVTVKNESDEVIAIGEITTSKALVEETHPVDPDEFQGTCRLEFVVENVPSSAFYQLEVAGQATPPVSHEELEAQGWTVVFTIE